MQKLGWVVFQNLTTAIPGSIKVTASQPDLWNIINLFDHITDNPHQKRTIIQAVIKKRILLIDSFSDKLDTPAFAHLKELKAAMEKVTAAGGTATAESIWEFGELRLQQALYYVSELLALGDLYTQKAAPGADTGAIDQQISAQEAKLGNIYVEATKLYGLTELADSTTTDRISKNFKEYQVALQVIESSAAANTAQGSPMAQSGQKIMTAFPILDENGKLKQILMEENYLAALERHKALNDEKVSVTQTFPLTVTLTAKDFTFVQTYDVRDLTLYVRENLNWKIKGNIGATNLGLKDSTISAPDKSSITLNTGFIDMSTIHGHKVNLSVIGDISDTKLFCNQAAHNQNYRCEGWIGSYDCTLVIGGKIIRSTLSDILPLTPDKGLFLAPMTDSNLTTAVSKNIITAQQPVQATEFANCSLELLASPGFSFTNGKINNRNNKLTSNITFQLSHELDTLDLRGLVAENSTITIKSETQQPKTVCLDSAQLTQCILKGAGLDKVFTPPAFEGV
jgi:hypothetical protein